ncbi:MAG: aspartate-semialdehyde dehydrogenase [Deltaproteobacteria bacterium CG11_big_fil_rev_8_21_14_0_20_47_16]|nr:MAG: aspartate-semialdehyde dehydrogenase [Deltaproteobacteria bacterium CG11_big_fil_rev_8_21_14_0_20_47_16]
MSGLTVAVVGATGLVGEEMIRVLEERKFPVAKLVPLASERSSGKSVEFNGKTWDVQTLSKDSFKGVDVALFSAGGNVSADFCPVAAAAGAVAIDNSSAFRMEADIPLVVPEVNPQTLNKLPERRIIANPNCSTIQLVVVLKPIHDAAKIKRVVVSTYQSVSGAGKEAIEELSCSTRALYAGEDLEPRVFAHRIAFNCLPHIDVFTEDGYTKEEIKMIKETNKIMGDDSIKVSATAVRVPVYFGHSESVNIETEKPMSAETAREFLERAPGVVVLDDPGEKIYPLASECAGRDEVFVGRIRNDPTVAHGLNCWIVADNIRKGAATNAVQIAELLLKQKLIG